MTNLLIQTENLKNKQKSKQGICYPIVVSLLSTRSSAEDNFPFNSCIAGVKYQIKCAPLQTQQFFTTLSSLVFLSSFLSITKAPMKTTMK